MTVLGLKFWRPALAPSFAALCAFAAAVGVSPVPANADDRLNRCIVDVCMDLFRKSGQERTAITLRPAMTVGTHINIIYTKSVLLGPQQFEVPFTGSGARFQVFVKQGGVYHFSAQICQRGGFLQTSSCAPWRRFTYHVNKL